MLLIKKQGGNIRTALILLLVIAFKNLISGNVGGWQLIDANLPAKMGYGYLCWPEIIVMPSFS